MNLSEAIQEANKIESLSEALAYLAVWETERAIKQQNEWLLTGVSTAGHGGSHDTCFALIFRTFLEQRDARSVLQDVEERTVSLYESVPAVVPLVREAVQYYTEEYLRRTK